MLLDGVPFGKIIESRVGLSLDKCLGRGRSQHALSLFFRRAWPREPDHGRPVAKVLRSSSSPNEPISILGAARDVADAARRMFPRPHFRDRPFPNQKSKIKN